MMTDENTYTAPDGTRYRAVDTQFSCEGCALEKKLDCVSAKRPRCTRSRRADNRNIIWIKETP